MSLVFADNAGAVEVSSEQSRALVTGATGFIGRALVHILRQRGWDVHVLSGLVRPTTSLAAQATVHPYDGSRAALDAALVHARPSIVFHLASRVVIQHSPADIPQLLDANVRLGTELADAMVAARVHKLVLATSYWQHYLGEDYLPVNLYAATKQALQTILRYYTSATPLRVRALTLFETYGPADERHKLITLLRRAAATGVTLDLTPGEQLLDMVHVSDVAEAFLAAARTLEASEEPELEFAATSGKLVSVPYLVHTIEGIMGRQIPVAWGARTYRDREVMSPWRGAAPPGWSARIGLEEGLRKTFTADGVSCAEPLAVT